MGLDAVVYRSRKSLSDQLVEQVDLVDPETGSLEYKGRSYGQSPLHPGSPLIACGKGLGNVAMVGWLAEEITKRCPGCTVLLDAVLYSGSHSGDFISVERMEHLDREIKQLASQQLPMEPDLKMFLESMCHLVEAAKANQNPIVFV